jgi:hypothetical protein
MLFSNRYLLCNLLLVFLPNCNVIVSAILVTVTNASISSADNSTTRLTTLFHTLRLLKKCYSYQALYHNVHFLESLNEAQLFSKQLAR